jgi:hypothetical protein
MSADGKSGRRTDAALLGGGVLMILCCAVGPAVARLVSAGGPRRCGRCARTAK